MDPSPCSSVAEGVDTVRGVRGNGVLLVGTEPLASRPVRTLEQLDAANAPTLLAASDVYGMAFTASPTGV